MNKLIVVGLVMAVMAAFFFDHVLAATHRAALLHKRHVAAMTCTDVREFVATHGTYEALQIAKQRGISAAQINRAKSCLGEGP